MNRVVLRYVGIPRGLDARLKRLAQRNGLTPSDLIRLAIEARLPDYETGRLAICPGGHCRVRSSAR